MISFAEASAPNISLPAAMAAVLACVVVWGLAIDRWRRGRSVAPYQPRRPAPWRIIDVALAMGMYVAMPMYVGQLVQNWRPMGAAVPPPVDEKVECDTAHPLARVLLESESGWAVLVCALTAVVIAPIIEELLFRLLLQGWLESVERRLRRRIRQLRFVTAGMTAVTASSFLFAALHFREPSPVLDPDTLVFLICVRAIANLMTAGLVVCWLRFVTGATLTDLGIVPRKLGTDVKLGMMSFLAVAVPVYGLLILAGKLLPENAVVDPIPLFLLAVVLGGLYYRTHRIVPAIVVHAAFNATGVLLAIWTR